MKKLKIRHILFFVICLLQLLAEIHSLAAIFCLGMLPGQYFILLVMAFGLLSFLTAFLFFHKKKKTKAKRVSMGQIAGVILAAAIITGSAAASAASLKVSQTLAVMTEPVEAGSVIAVYVRKDDPASALEDVRGYTFAVPESLDVENLKKALEALQDKLGEEPAAAWEASLLEAVDALYGQRAGALLLNEAYAGILEDLEDYEDFSKQTRILYEISVGEQGYDRESQTEEETEYINDSPETPGISNTPFILYLSGSDTRKRQLTASRSDMNILAVVNPVTKQLLLVNTPRDYYVQNPAGGEAMDKLTNCGIYGIQCSIDALSGLYQKPIDYYVQINFAGFETLIDAIGGVDIYSDTAFITYHGKYEIQKGNNHLNGSQALGYVRERYALAGGDNDRGKNQMKIITAMIKQISAQTVITKYEDILDSLQGMFLTDMTSEEIAELVRMQLADWSEWNVVSYAVTGKSGRDTTYSMPGRSLYVMYPDEETVEHASLLIDRVLSGEIVSKDG